jgi:DNA segregation ATPase FtsK/SpoIIIE, S-DNA-T family
MEEPNKIEKPKRSASKNKRRKQIIGILVMVISLLIFFAIVSYSAKDEANTDLKFGDIFKIVFSPDAKLQAKADTTTNWLGITGAIISNFFITSTIGYFSIIFPLLFGAWGFHLFKGIDNKKLLYITNLSIIYGVIIATFIGLLKNIPLFSFFKTQWVGSIGAFISTGMARLIGTFGGIIIILTIFFFMLMLSADLNLQQTMARLKKYFNSILAWWKDSGKKKEEPVEEEILEDEENITDEAPIPQKEEEEEEALEVVKPVIQKPQPPEKKTEEPLQEEFPEEKPEEPGIKSSANIEELTDEKKSGEIPDLKLEYVFPTIDILDIPKQQTPVSEYEINKNKEMLISKLSEFNIMIKDDDISVQVGPVFSLYEIVPPEKVKISQIVSLKNDLQLALQAKRIRIIAPMPGRGTVGIEISNRIPSNVYFREIINSKYFKEAKFTLPIAMGRSTVVMEKTTTGEIFCADLASIPHLLMAGATGSGKSIGINTIIASILYKMHPSDVKLVFIDPKKVELKLYEQLKNHFLARCPDITDEDIITSPQNAITVLRSIVKEMDIRYDKLSKCGVRNIKDYNQKLLRGEIHNHEYVKQGKLPYVVVIIDELADLMITAAKEVEEPIARIAQLARAVGIHLIIATQRPSVDVITGTIKANFPARIAYQVASTIDSRTILNQNGAEDLIGKGDMLFLSSMSPEPIRIQNAYISTEEVEKIVEFISNQPGGRSGPFNLPSLIEPKSAGGTDSLSGDLDELFEEAAKLVVRHQQGSVSLVQRRLKVGYSRAARLIDQLEKAGIVGPFDGSKARAVLVETEDELQEILDNL